MPKNKENKKYKLQNTWDLTKIYKNISDPEIFNDLKSLLSQAEDFEKEHSKKIAGYSESRVLHALQEYSQIAEKLYLIGAYAELCFSADSADPKINSLYQKVQLKSNDIENHFIFLTLELAKNKKLADFAQSKKTRPYNIIFNNLLKLKKHQLSYQEEKIISVKSLTSVAGWVKIFDKLEAQLNLKLKDKTGKSLELSLEEALKFLYSGNRQERKRAALAITEVLKNNLPTTTHIYNMLLLNKMQEDSLRNWLYPEAERHIYNSVTKESINQLSEITKNNFDIVVRYYKVKRKLLKLSKLSYYDRYAPIPLKAENRYTYDQAVDIVNDAFNKFDPEFAKYFTEIIKAGHVDVYPRRGKRSGAFCMYMPLGHKPYVLLNFLNSPRDVETLAHEMGHAIHDCYAGQQSFIVAHPPLTLAETASVFGEMLVFEALLAKAKSKTEKIVLISEKIDGIIATIFRQMAMYFFEQRIHNYIKENGEISSENINEFWLATQKEMFGDSVELPEDYSVWWSYISHFFHSPFYVYSYAFGNLLVLSLYEKYKQGMPDFVENYKKLLSFGGVKTPAEALRVFGFDLESRDFWQNGFNVLKGLLEQLEVLCK